MAKKRGKVLYLEREREEFSAIPSESANDIFSGFSDRFNQLIDLSDLDIPPPDAGRVAYISHLFDASRMGPSDWLKHNRVPRSATLRKIVVFLLRHIEGQYSTVRVEAWLKYGEAAIPNPFAMNQSANQALIPLATSLIVSIAREEGVAVTRFDLSVVLDQVLRLLSEFHVREEALVEPVHRRIIAQHIIAEANK